MPKLLKETRVVINWTDIDARVHRDPPESMAVRSSGVHLSGVIRYVLDLRSPDQDEDPDEMPLCMAVGMAWEAWAIGLWPYISWQPGEEELDGVFGTPDGIGRGEDDLFDELIIEEFKATWMSRFTHGDVLSERKYLYQLMGLCKLTGLNYARLHVLWINGDYRPPKPEYRTYLFEFSNEELDRFWRNIVLNNKDHAIPEAH